MYSISCGLGTGHHTPRTLSYSDDMFECQNESNVTGSFGCQPHAGHHDGTLEYEYYNAVSGDDDANNAVRNYSFGYIQTRTSDLTNFGSEVATLMSGFENHFPNTETARFVITDSTGALSPLPSIKVSRPELDVNDHGQPFNTQSRQDIPLDMRGLSPSDCSTNVYNRSSSRSRSRSSSFVSTSGRTTSPPTSMSSPSYINERSPRNGEDKRATSHASFHIEGSTAFQRRQASPKLLKMQTLTSTVCGTDAAFRVDGPSYREVRRRKARISNSDRRAICLYSATHAGVTQEWMARQYKVERSTISKIIREKAKWLGCGENASSDSASRQRPSKFPEMENLMVPWLEKMSRGKQPITDSSIRNKAREVAHTLHISHNQFKASSGWVDNFKRRHNIRKGMYQGGQEHESNSKNSRDIDEERSSEGNRREDHGHAVLRQDRRQIFGQNYLREMQVDSAVVPQLMSVESEAEPNTYDPRIRDAFKTIFSWIETKGPHFLSSDERTMLKGLAERI